MLLKNKIAIIYGAGGAIGGAVAQAFAKEGAIVYMAGRTMSKLEIVAEKINAAGGIAYTAQADALDEHAVENLLEKIVHHHNQIDISFNAIGFNDMQGESLINMKTTDFVLPVTNAISSHFITAAAAARLMKKQGCGIILAITANAGYKPYDNVGGFGVACAAIEGFCRQIALENGRYGIRVACLRSAGSPDAPGVDEVFNLHAKNAGISREAFENNFAERTMLKRLPKLMEVANTALWLASDKASAITAAVINVTCGEIAD